MTEDNRKPILNRFLNYIKGVALPAASSVAGTVLPQARAVQTLARTTQAATMAATPVVQRFPGAVFGARDAFEGAMGAVGAGIETFEDAAIGGFLLPGRAPASIAPGVVGGQAARLGVSPQITSDVVRSGTQRVEEQVAEAEETFETEVEPIGPVGPLIHAAYRVEQGWSHAVTRPASTFALLTDPTSPLYQGGRLDVGDVSKESIEGFQWQDVIDAWNRSADISFGRAVAASPFFANTAGLLGGVGKYNPWSDTSMAEADENAYYNFLTGTIDLGLEVVFPTKGIRPARIAATKKAGLSTTVNTGDDLIRMRADYEMHRVHLAAREVQDTARAAEDLVGGGDALGILPRRDVSAAMNREINRLQKELETTTDSARRQKILEDIERLRDYESRFGAQNLSDETATSIPRSADEAVLRSQETPIGRMVDEIAAETNPDKLRGDNPVVANSTGLDKDRFANILARTDDPDTVFELIAASRGDITALRKIFNSAPDHLLSLSEIDVAIRNAWIDGKPPMPTGAADQFLRQAFDTSARRNEYFSEVLDMFLSDGAPTAGSFWMPTRSIIVEEIRKAGRKTEYAIKTADYDDAPRWISQATDSQIGQPVTVFLQWTSSRQPMGTVSRSGARPNDMFIEFEAMLNSLPILRGSRSVTIGQELVDGKLVPVIMPANEYRSILRQRLSEGNSRKQIEETYRGIEDEIVDIAADTIGLDRTLAREFVRGWRTQADAQAGFIGRNGYILDEAGKQVRVRPVSQRQFLDSFMTLPMSDIFLAMKSELSNIQKGLITAGQGSTAAFDAGLKFWRVNLLFRGGYLTKFGIMEPAVMSMLSHATLLTDEGLMATVGNFNRNNVRRVKRVAYSLDLDRQIKKHVMRQPVQTRRQLEAELKKLVQERHDTERIIDSLLSELDDIRLGRVSPARAAAYQEEVRGRLIEAQLRLDDIQGILDGKMPQWRQVIEPANLSDVRSSLRKYRAMLGEDPNYVRELQTEIADIQARAAARGRMTVNDRSKLEILVAQLDEINNVDPKTLTPELRDQIARLQSSYDDAIQYYKTPVEDPTIRIQELQQNLDRIDSQIQARQREIGKGRKETGDVTGDLAYEGSGQGYMTLNIGGEQFRVPSAFSDRGSDFGPGYRAEASATQTSRLTLDPSYRMGELNSQWKRTGAPQVIEPTNPIYWDELAYRANRQLRGERLIQLYLEGKSKAQIVAWLRTKEGIEYQKSMGKDYLVPYERYSDPVRPLPEIDPGVRPARDIDLMPSDQAGKVKFKKLPDVDPPTASPPSNLSPPSSRVMLESTTELDEIIRLIDQYFPDPKVRQMIAAREVTPGDLQKAMGGRDDLSRILTDDLIFTPQGEMAKTMGWVNKALDKIWSWIATMPEDRFARWPWYQREFRSLMEQRARILADQGVKMNNNLLHAMRREVHRQTLSNLEKTFYNIRRYNNPIYMSRFLFGFPGATFNAFYRYGRMAIREPERSVVGALTFERMLSNYGLDENGDPVDDIRRAKRILIPGTKRDPLDDGRTTSVESFLTMTFDWPAASYASTILLSQVAKSNPKTEEYIERFLGEEGMDAVFPYGLPRNPISGFFGPYQKDLWSAIRGESDEEFIRFAIEFFANRMANWEKNGSVGDSPTFEEAIKDARSFLYTRAGFRFMETFSTRHTPPGQFMRDAWFRTRDQYGDTREAREKYMEKYGEWARWYTYSSSNIRAYIPRSYDAYERVWEDDPDLTRGIVSILGDDLSAVSLIALGADDEFARPVSNFMRDSSLPGDNVPVITRMSPEKFNRIVMVDEGWTRYNNGKTIYDAERLRLRTLRDEAETDEETNKYRNQLNQLDGSWETWVDDLEQKNEPWAADRTSGFTVKPRRATIVLNKILRSKKFMAKHGREPIWRKVRDFLKQREIALKSIKEAENSQHKAQIREAFATYVEEKYIENDPAFSGMWDRWYAGEWVEDQQ